MFYTCSKCGKLVRQCNAVKHQKKCGDSVMHCCDCGQEVKTEELSNHTKCPNGMFSSLPPLFNPNSKTSNTNLDMLLLVDRAAAENKDASLEEMFTKLCSVDCIPQKKDGFVRYTMSLCKTDQDTSEKMWSVIDALHIKQKEEKHLRTSLLKRVRDHKKEKKEKFQKKRKTPKTVMHSQVKDNKESIVCFEF